MRQMKTILRKKNESEYEYEYEANEYEYEYEYEKILDKPTLTTTIVPTVATTQTPSEPTTETPTVASPTVEMNLTPSNVVLTPTKSPSTKKQSQTVEMKLFLPSDQSIISLLDRTTLDNMITSTLSVIDTGSIGETLSSVDFVSETLGSLTLTAEISDQGKKRLIQLIQTKMCLDAIQQCNVKWDYTSAESTSAESTLRRLTETTLQYVVTVVLDNDDTFADLRTPVVLTMESLNQDLSSFGESVRITELNQASPKFLMMITTTVNENDTIITNASTEDDIKNAVALAGRLDQSLLTTTISISSPFEPTTTLLGIVFSDVHYDETVHQNDVFIHTLETVIEKTIAIEMEKPPVFVSVNIVEIRKDGSSVIVYYRVTVSLLVDVTSFETIFLSKEFKTDLLEAIQGEPILHGKLVPEHQEETFWDMKMILYVAVSSGVIVLLVLFTCSSVMGRKNRRSHSRLQKTQAAQNLGDSYTLLDVIEEEPKPLVIPFDKQHHM